MFSERETFELKYLMHFGSTNAKCPSGLDVIRQRRDLYNKSAPKKTHLSSFYCITAFLLACMMRMPDKSETRVI